MTPTQQIMQQVAAKYPNGCSPEQFTTECMEEYAREFKEFMDSEMERLTANIVYLTHVVKKFCKDDREVYKKAQEIEDDILK